MRLMKYTLLVLMLLAGSCWLAAAEDGQVTIPLDAWTNLQNRLNQLQQQVDRQSASTTDREPPTAVLSSANYEARVVRGGLEISVTLRVTAFGAGRAELALFDGRSTVVAAALPPELSLAANGDRSVLLVKAPGSFEARLRLSVPAENNRAAFGVPRAGAALVRVLLPGTTASAKVEPAGGSIRKVDGGMTIVETALPITDEVTIEWSALGGSAETEQGPGRVYLSSATAAVVEGTAIRATSRLTYEIKGGSAAEFAVSVPVGVSIADVQGEGLASWKVDNNAGQQVLRLLPTAPVVGSAVYDMVWEIAVPRESEAAEIPRLSGLAVVREVGTVGVAGGEAIEVTGEGREGITPLDPREAPADLARLSERPFSYVGRYVGNSWVVAVGIKRLEAVEVVAAQIEEARGHTVLLPSGRQVTKLIANVRNSTVEYLDLQLPQSAIVWGAAVAGKTVLPIRGASDTTVRLPLVRAQSAESAGDLFQVEIVYALDAPEPGLGGLLTVVPPILSISVAKFYWSVSMPEEFRWCWDRSRDWDDHGVLMTGSGGGISIGRYTSAAPALPSTIHGFPESAGRVRATYLRQSLNANQSASDLSVLYLTPKPGRWLGILLLLASGCLTFRSLWRWECPRRWRIVVVVLIAIALVIEFMLGGGGLRRLVQGVIIGALLAGTGKLLEPDPAPDSGAGRA